MTRKREEETDSSSRAFRDCTFAVQWRQVRRRGCCYRQPVAPVNFPFAEQQTSREANERMLLLAISHRIVVAREQDIRQRRQQHRDP